MRQEAATLKAIQNWLDMRKMLYIRVNPISPVGPGRWRKIRASQKGAPDLIVFYRNIALCFEVKSRIGKQSPAQKVWGERAKLVGAYYFVVKCFDEFILALSESCCDLRI